MPPDGILTRLADLLVGFGANVQPGQIVAIAAETGKEELVRELARSSYRHGAKFVDVAYFDPYVKRARIELADEESLDFIPSWYGQRMLALGDQHCARIALSGPTTPGLLDDLDPERVGRDQLPFLPEAAKVLNERTTNWTIGPCPVPAWAGLVHPDLEPDAALEKLWEEIVHVCRLDAADPVDAWRERMAVVAGAAERLTAHRFDALHYEGTGTDLTIGLLPDAIWTCAQFTTIDDLPHMPNIPSEEIFSSPDPMRVDGVVRSTKPLVLQGGAIVRDLVLKFEGGRAVEFLSSSGGDTLRTLCARDDGGSRLGEIALVDREGRIGPLGTVFYDTLLDENAASHLAFGQGFGFTMPDEETRKRVNESRIHIDFMIGSNELQVTGITASGDRVPVLRDGTWQI